MNSLYAKNIPGHDDLYTTMVRRLQWVPLDISILMAYWD